jgi:hypothetical protein
MENVILSIAAVQAALDFVGQSSCLPDGWTVARTHHLVEALKAARPVEASSGSDEGGTSWSDEPNDGSESKR